jgi:hypothetical protein
VVLGLTTARADMFTMPVAFALFSLMVRSYRLLMLCLMNAFITVVTSFGALALITRVSKRMPLSVNTQLVEVIALAMSIDYALFLLRRYRDEIKNGRSSSEATKIMLSQAGHVVALSSFTFSMVFMGFVFLPSNDLATMGQVRGVARQRLDPLTRASARPGLRRDGADRPRRGHLQHRGHALPLPRLLFRARAPRLRRQVPPRLNGRRRRCRSASAARTGRDLHRPAPAPPRRAVQGRLLYLSARRHQGWFPDRCALCQPARQWPLNVVLIVVVYGAALPLALNLFRLKINQDPMCVCAGGGSTAGLRKLQVHRAQWGRCRQVLRDPRKECASPVRPRRSPPPRARAP